MSFIDIVKDTFTTADFDVQGNMRVKTLQKNYKLMEKDKYLYKPLPDNECIKLTIAKSKIQGLGLFTKLFEPKGVNFGVS